MRFDIQALKHIFIGLILLCGVTYLFFNYAYKPMENKRIELDTEISKKKEELKETQKIVANLDIKKVEFEKVKKELEYVIQRLPTKREIPELLKTITTLALNSHIELLSFTPNPPESKDVYEEIKVNLSIKGTYHNLGRFLTDIGNLERIVTPSTVNISANEPTNKDSSTTNANLIITAFIYKEH